jgi:GAF domain-containing protein
MSHPEHVSQGLRALSHFLVGDATVTDTLTRVAELATTSLDAAFAGITLDTARGPRTSVFTDPQSPAIDQAQYEADHGPCLDAMRTGHVNRIDFTADDNRWPAFSRAAFEHGINSTLSLPLTALDHMPSGALNLYAREVAAFDDGAEADGADFAEQAAVVLLNAEAYWSALELSEQLQHALDSRPSIEQAKGIMIAREGCTPEQAFDILVRASQRTNVKLRDLAASIVERAQQPDAV